MNLKKIMAVLAALSLSASALAGCGTAKKSEGTETTATPAATAAAVAGPQIVSLNLGSEPPQLNTTLTTDTVSGDVLRHIMEGLTRLDKDSKPIPGVAKEWKISDDKLTYTFTLRDDAKWSDGTKVTAKDFEFAYKTVLSKATASEYAYIMYCFKNAEAFNNEKEKWENVGVKATDDKTLVLTLERPTPYLLDMLTFYVFMPVNETFYKKNINGDKNLNGTEADKILFNGPFTMKEWKHEDKIVLAKNANYWNNKNIKLDEITMYMIKDSNASLNKFLANEIDMVGLKGDQIPAVEKEGYKVNHYNDGATFYFEFNLKDKVMANKNIRKALTYAIDRQTFITGVQKNSSLPALSFTTPAVRGKNGAFADEVGKILKDNNTEEAKKLLDAGVKELGLSAMPKISLVVDDSDTAKRDAAAYQQYWKKNLGVDVEIKSVTFKSRLDLLKNKDFQICISGWGPDYNDPMTFLDMFETGNGNNHTSYSDKDYDAQLAAIRNEKDAGKRMDLLVALEKKLMEDLPIGPIYFRVRDYVLKPYVKGVVRDVWQNINFCNAYVEGKK